jgi:hypothetical protein
MGKSDANECNENSFSNCRVQLALSIKKDGMILEKQHRVGRLHPLPFWKGRGLGSGLRTPSSQEGDRGVEKCYSA